MKRITYSKSAARALLKHRNRAASIREKIEQYAGNPASLVNNVTEMVGTEGKRLRIGDFRVLFVETAQDIIVVDIAPRCAIYR